MIDIARRQGLEIDLDRLSAEIGMPVIPTVAVRKGGVEDLMAAVDRLVPRAVVAGGEWREPTAAEIRASHREAERIIKAAVGPAQAARHLDRPAGLGAAAPGARQPHPAGGPCS